ncbi:unnamed protein product [Closterium sp. NIES-53]
MEDSCNSVILFHTPVSIGSPHHQPGGQPIPPAQYTGAQNTGKSCKSLSRSFNCQSNGRTNMRYLQYEWRSPGCRIERFDASAFLERVRNKVFLVVGDSVSMNFISALQCLIETATPTKEFKVVDVTALSVLRPDGHLQNHCEHPKAVDCMHWCLPGVLDTWADIIYSHVMEFM